MTPDIAIGHDVGKAELADLYGSLGWVNYTRDLDGLATAIANSNCVVTARANGKLVGLARGLSDDVSIFYLQDILVHPEHQRRGIGRAMLAKCLDRYRHVRQKVLLTDDEPLQHRFYESMGYADTKLISNIGLHAFVQIDGLELETEEPGLGLT